MTKPPDSFNARLRQLDARQRIAFIAALRERLVPNYALYAVVSGQGNPGVLHNVLDLVWERLKIAAAKIDFDKQAEKLADVEPPEADDSFGARRATEAVMAFDFADDDSVRKMGYVGEKRYVRMTITPVGNTGNIPIAIIAIMGDADRRPTTAQAT